MKNKGYWLLLGYTLFTLGLTAIIMQMVGVQWAFLSFIELGGRLLGFLVKVLMVLAGVWLITMAHTDWKREREESSSENDEL